MFPDLNRLHVFYYVYSFKSIIKAARELRLTQPAVSQQIKKLEIETRAPLFIRLHKKIIPTSAGDQLYLMVKPFIETIKENIKSISNPQDKPSGNLKIGAPFEFGKKYLPEICHMYRKKFKDVTFCISLEESDKLLVMLKEGELDFALIDYFSTKDQFFGRPALYKIEPLIEETLILACSKAYYTACITDDISFEKLLCLDYVTDEHEPVILKHWFWHHFKKQVFDLNIVLTIDSHQALLSCIKCGMGLGITATHLVWKEIQKGSICAISPGKTKMISRISLVQLAGKIPTFTEKSFQTYLKTWIERKVELKEGN